MNTFHSQYYDKIMIMRSGEDFSTTKFMIMIMIMMMRCGEYVSLVMLDDA